MLADSRIKAATAKLESGHFTVGEFLKTTCHLYKAPNIKEVDGTENELQCDLAPLQIGIL